MYYDEENLYRSQSEGQVRQYYANLESTPPYTRSAPKRVKKRGGAKIAALALCCALVGGAVGGGAAWTVANRAAGGTVVRETSIQVSDRAADPVSVISNGASKTPLSFAQIYASQVDSCVSINTTGESSYNVFGQRVITASSGSGFVLTSDGYIATNYHVIEGGTEVKVTFQNGDTYDASIIGGDKDYDIAVLKIEGENFKAVTLGDSNLLNVGEPVSTIGNPLGELTFSMSEGVASSVNRAINVEGTPFNMIQVTCAINPGNSGGPLFNQFGEVVGIVSAKYSRYASTSVEGLGFAIPMNDVLSMIEDIITNGYVTNKPYLGITPGTLTRQMAANYQYDVSSGVIVYSVEPGSAAEKAGLRQNDIITKVDNNTITSYEDLVAAKKKYSAGDKAVLTVYRAGETLTMDVIWDSVPAEQQTPVQQQPQQSQPGNGNTYGYPFSDDFFRYFFGNGFAG